MGRGGGDNGKEPNFQSIEREGNFTRLTPVNYINCYSHQDQFYFYMFIKNTFKLSLQFITFDSSSHKLLF